MIRTQRKYYTLQRDKRHENPSSRQVKAEVVLRFLLLNRTTLKMFVHNYFQYYYTNEEVKQKNNKKVKEGLLDLKQRIQNITRT